MEIAAESMALLLLILGLATFVLSWLKSRRVGEAILMMLDLWTAAGLIRLSGLQNWEAIMTVSVVIALRKVIAHTLKRKSLPHPLQDETGTV